MGKEETRRVPPVCPGSHSFEFWLNPVLSGSKSLFLLAPYLTDPKVWCLSCHTACEPVSIFRPKADIRCLEEYSGRSPIISSERYSTTSHPNQF